jgi:RHS repeat-associated protein
MLCPYGASAQVTTIGAYSTGVKIEVPSFYGIEPQISLSYNSNAGMGFVGRGWDLAATSYIARAAPRRGAPKYDTSDIFLIDGIELIPCAIGSSSPSCTTGGTHSTKVENFKKIKQDSLKNQWIAWEKNGTKLIYNYLMGRSTAVNDTFRWALSSAVDTHGNQVYYSYSCNSECYLDRITYGNSIACKTPPPVPDGQSAYVAGREIPGAEIKFYWDEQNATYPALDYSYGNGDSIVEAKFLLKTIDVKFAGWRQHGYALEYGFSANDGAASLRRVRTFGADAVINTSTGDVTAGTQLPPIEFETPAITGSADIWSGSTVFAASFSIPSLGTAYNQSYYEYDSNLDYDPPWIGDPDGSQNQWLAIEMNGDGLTDFLTIFPYRDSNNNELLGLRSVITNRERSASPVYSTNAIQQTGIAYKATIGSDSIAATSHRLLPADVNGDGITDVIFVTNPGTTSKGGPSAGNVTIVTLLSKRDGTFDTSLPTFTTNISGWDQNYNLDRNANRDRWMTGDVDGDGRSDIIVIRFHPRCTPTSSTRSGCNPNASPPQKDWHAAFYTGISNGTGNYTFYYQETNWSMALNNDPGWTIGDVNGDGKTDIIRGFDHGYDFQSGDSMYNQPHAAIQVALSEGNGLFAIKPIFDTTNIFAMYVAGPEVGHMIPIGHDKVLPGDFNGDGRTDLALVDRYKITNPNGSTTTKLLFYVAFNDDGNGKFYFTQYQSSLGVAYNNAELSATSWADGPSFPNKWQVADVNADGASDIVIMSPSCPYCSCINPGASLSCSDAGFAMHLFRLVSDKKGNFTERSIYNVLGWPALCYNTRSGSATDKQCLGDTMFDLALGDVNGDARSDIVFIGRYKDSNGNTKVRFRSDLSPNYSEDLQNWRAADINGDGRMDLVYLQEFYNAGFAWNIHAVVNNGGGNYARPVPNGYAASPNIDNASPAGWVVMDTGGPTSTAPDGKADLVYVDHYPNSYLRIFTMMSEGAGTWRPLPNNGNYYYSFTLTYNAEFPADYHAGGWIGTDVNGDGRGDLVHVYHKNGAPHIHTILSNGDGTWNWVATSSFFSGLADLYAWRWKSLDFNGDGKSDLALVTSENGQGVVYSLRSNFAPGNTTWTATRSSVITPSGVNIAFVDTQKWLSMDINGDSLTDLVYVQYTDANSPGLGYFVVHGLLSKGNGQWQYTDGGSTFYADGSISYYADGQNFRPLDLNDDGKVDLVRVVSYRTGTDYKGLGTINTAVHMIRNKAAYGWAGSTQLALGFAYPNCLAWMQMDTDVDGRDNLAFINGSSGVSSLYYGGPTERLTREYNGLMGSAQITYKTSAGAHTYLPHGMLIDVVDSVAKRDEVSATTYYPTSYSYSGALWNDAERLFLGFAAVKAQDNSSIKEQVYEQSAACGNREQITYVKGLNGAVIRYASYDFVSTGSSAPYTCQVWNRYDNECETSSPCRRKQTQFSYDSYGSPTTITDYGDTSTVADDRRTISPPAYNTSAYIVDLPSYRNVDRWDTTLVPASWITGSSQLFEYDSNTSYIQPPAVGELRRVKVWNNENGSYVTTAYEYDTKGNVTKTTDPSGIWKTTAYDCNYKRYPVQSCNSLFCTSKSWDLGLGLLKSETDENSQIVSYLYDKLNRQTKASFPDGSYQETAYLDFGTNDQRVLVRQSDESSDGVLQISKFFDGLERTYKEVTESPSGAAAGELIKQYEYEGETNNVWRESKVATASETRQWTTFAYDAAKRRTMTTLPDGSTLRRVFRIGYVEVYDELNNMKEIHSDVFGRTGKIRERHRTCDDSGENCGAWEYYDTIYDYDVLDRLTRATDALGHRTTVVWNSLGEKRQHCDQDMGCRNFVYARNSSLWREIDDRAQEIEYLYDSVGRNTVKRFKNSSGAITRTVTMTYDRNGGVSQGASLNRLVKVDDVEGNRTLTESYWYDSTGRVTTEQRCQGANCYTTNMTFNRAGRLKDLTYPDGEVVNHTYDNTGRLTKVSNYADQITYNSASQITQMRFQSGVTQNYTYDPQRFWLTQQNVRPVWWLWRMPNLFSVTYTHDKAGHVKKQTITTPSAMDMTYVYDDLHRLVKATSALDPSRNQDYRYNAIGNVIFSTMAGTYQYTDASHMHAVTKTSGVTALKFSWLATRCAGGTSTITFKVNGRTVLTPNTDSSCSCMPMSGIGRVTVTDPRLLGYLVDGTNTFAVEFPGTAQYLGWAQVELVGGTGNVVIYDANGGTGVQTRADRCSPLPGSVYNPPLQSKSVNVPYSVYQYDANGNLTSGRGMTLTWTTDNRPATIQYNGMTTRYAYDRTGQRIEKEVGSNVTQYYGRYIERESSGSLVKYYYVGDKLIAKRDPSGAVQYYHQDYLDSTRLTTNAARQVVSRFDYAPYGNATAGNRFGYAGQEFDDETSLIYMDARYYEPSLGRFISSDSVVPDLLNPQSLNRYSYVYNNPISYKDPTGYQAKGSDPNEWAPWPYDQKAQFETIVRAPKGWQPQLREFEYRPAMSQFDRQWWEFKVSVYAIGTGLLTYYEIADYVTTPAQIVAMLPAMRKPLGANLWEFEFLEQSSKEAAENSLRAEAVKALAKAGVKHTPQNIVSIGRVLGKVVSLEIGTAEKGLEHIIKEHAADFAAKGVEVGEIPEVVMKAVTEGELIGFQGKGPGRPIVQIMHNGRPLRIAVTVGDNGFIVGANPVR